MVSSAPAGTSAIACTREATHARGSAGSDDEQHSAPRRGNSKRSVDVHSRKDEERESSGGATNPNLEHGDCIGRRVLGDEREALAAGAAAVVEKGRRRKHPLVEHVTVDPHQQQTLAARRVGSKGTVWAATDRGDGGKRGEEDHCQYWPNTPSRGPARQPPPSPGEKKKRKKTVGHAVTHQLLGRKFLASVALVELHEGEIGGIGWVAQ